MGLFVWYFGTSRRYDDVAHHTILLGPRYRELLRDIFDRKRLSADFSLYLHRPTATDRSLAPKGCDAFYVLSPVPNLMGGQDWRVEAEPYRQAIARALEASMLPGLTAGFDDLAHCDPAGLPEPAEFVPRRGIRARTHPDPERMVSPAQCERGRAQPFSRRRRRPPGRRFARRPFIRAYSRQGRSACLSLRLNGPWRASATMRNAERAIREGSRSFYAASRLLPAAVRRSAFGLYAFCRLSDDAVDLEGGSPAALASLRDRLVRASEGRPLPFASRSGNGRCPAPLRHPDCSSARASRRPRVGRRRPDATKASMIFTSTRCASPEQSAS